VEQYARKRRVMGETPITHGPPSDERCSCAFDADQRATHPGRSSNRMPLPANESPKLGGGVPGISGVVGENEEGKMP